MENIAYTQLSDIPPLQQCLFVAIDLQREFCDPHYGDDPRGHQVTVDLCKKINVLSPEFNQLNLRTCWLYYVDPRHTPHPEWACGGFYIVKPQPDDFVIHKKHNSAFTLDPSPFGQLLEQEKITTLVVGGVNLSACVKDTVKDAIAYGYDVILVTDLCANDAGCYGDLAYFRQKIAQQYQALENVGMPDKKYGRISYTNSGALLTMLEQRNDSMRPARTAPRRPPRAARP